MKTMIVTMFLCFATACAVDATPTQPTTSETSAAISCSQTICHPYTCDSVGNCVHNLGEDLNCQALSCDGATSSSCGDNIEVDSGKCNLFCRNNPFPTFTDCFEACMNRVTKHCINEDL